MRILITGDNDFDEFQLLKRRMDELTAKLKRVEVVSGHRGVQAFVSNCVKYVGAERLGEEWAASRKYMYHIYRLGFKFSEGPAETEDDLVEAAQQAVVFWDGENQDTKKLIAKLRKRGLKPRVVLY